MRGALLAILVAGIGCVGIASAAGQADAIVGTWLTSDGSSRIQVADSGGVWNGRVVWLAEPAFPANDPHGMAGKPKVDRLNPDPSLRGRPVLGMTVLSGLHYAGNGAWEGGTIYTPATGKAYPCRASLAPDGDLQLSVGGSVFGRTLTWKRATPAG